MPWAAWARPIHVVAAENVYGDLATQIGGSYVAVTNCIGSQKENPHLFQPDDKTLKAIEAADLIIMNGIGYDSWMKDLVEKAKISRKKVIVIAELMKRKNSDNPHIWYYPNAMIQLAEVLVEKFSTLKMTQKETFEQNYALFKGDSQKLLNLIAMMKEKHKGKNVIATEPIFNYMAYLLQLKMQGHAFQLSIMNGKEPSETDVADFKNALVNKKVSLLICNTQVTTETTEKMKRIAKQAGIPIVAVSETEPSDKEYVDWMLEQLRSVDRALSQS